MKKLLILFLVAIFAIALVGCGGGNDEPAPTPTPTPTPTPDPEPTPALLNFEGISLSDLTVTYNGAEHKLEIAGNLPTGATVTYTGNTATDAGTYPVSARLECEGYNTKTLTATLKINKADITGITFDGKTVEYDTDEHSIAVLGNVPSGVVVSYTCDGDVFTSASQVGTYNIAATLSGKNYNTLILNATLTIKSTEEQLYAANFNGVIYFQNGLDGKKLYKVENGEIEKVNNDIPEYFYNDGSCLYYYSSAFLGKALKRITASGEVETVISSLKGEYVSLDGTYVYYAVNTLLSKEAGIWKYKLDGSAEPTRISENKAAYITLVDSKLYYSNKSDGGKLYVMSTSGGTSTRLHDEKVSYIIADNGTLYFDSAKLLGSAIYKYDTTDGTLTKMTTDSGKYLVKVGNYIYYVNNDLLTSNVFGDGIYRVSTVISSGSFPGAKILSATDNGYSSLASDGEYLYYYKLNDKHLYMYDPASGEEVDLMEGYEPPVEKVIPVGDTVVAIHNGEIYYTNPLDGVMNGACLYKYNPITNQHVKVLAADVAGIWFYGDKMFYSTCVLTNYALYCMDLTTSEVVKVNSDRCQDLIFEGDYVYYLKVNVVLGKNTIMKMAIADIGTEVEPTVIYNEKNVAVTGLSKVGDTFYFVVNPTIGKQKIYRFTVGEKKATDLGETAFALTNNGDILYFYDDYDNAIKCYNGGAVTTVVADVNVNDLVWSGEALYFSSTKGKVGVYVYNGELVKISDRVGEALTVDGNNLWFIATAVNYVADYPVHSGDGDCALYCYDGTTLTKK